MGDFRSGAGWCVGGRIELAGRGLQRTAMLNEMCELSQRAVPAGSYTLRVRLSEMEIDIPAIELKA